MPITGLPAFTDNYIWVIVNELEHTFTCVDPGTATPVLSYAKKYSLQLKNILITHHHPDHTGGITDLLHNYPKTYVYGPDDPRIPEVNFIVHDEEIIHIDQFAFRILNTPGHTSSHICYQEPTQGWLFCGDTLFSAGCGRVFDGTIEELHDAIMLLKNLPPDTKIYCGHEYTRQNLRFAAKIEPENRSISSYYEYLDSNAIQCSLPSSIALEREINPFMRTNLPSLQAYAAAHGITSSDTLAIFKLLRQQKNTF